MFPSFLRVGLSCAGLSRAGRYAMAALLCAQVSACEVLEQIAPPSDLAAQPVIGQQVFIPVPSDPRGYRERHFETVTPSIVGYLDRPADGALQGAVVLLHGCQGLDFGTRLSFIDWIEWWKQRGYATLVIDSLTQRKIDQACIGQDAQQEVDLDLRMADALAAAGFLRETLGVPADRIGLLGFSYGGEVAVTLARSQMPGFRWSIALYPGCNFQPHANQQKPTLIFVGQADDWTGGDYCGETTDIGMHIRVVELPNARHLFDQPLPERIAFGHRVGFDPDALTQTRRAIDGFLSRVVRQPQTRAG